MANTYLGLLIQSPSHMGLIFKFLFMVHGVSKELVFRRNYIGICWQNTKAKKAHLKKKIAILSMAKGEVFYQGPYI